MRLAPLMVLLLLAPCLTGGPATARDRDHDHGRDRRREPPCPPPPVCRKPKPQPFEIGITSIDAARAALPAVDAALAGTSNPQEQRDALRAQAKAGAAIFRVAYGPPVFAAQDKVGVGESRRDGGQDQPDRLGLAALRSRVSARPHLDARCAEAVDLAVEQAPVGLPWTGRVIRITRTFENGDTRLLSDTAGPNGVHHLVYATVFFPPRAVPCPR